MLEPIGKLCSYWPDINNAISKRHKKVGWLLLHPLELSGRRS